MYSQSTGKQTILFQHFYWLESSLFNNVNSAYLCTRVGHVVERREVPLQSSRHRTGSRRVLLLSDILISAYYEKSVFNYIHYL